MNKEQPIALLGGARPNFMKIAPLSRALKKDFKTLVIHTGQHHDQRMSGQFLRELGLRADIVIHPSKKSANTQIEDISWKLEKIFDKEKPSLVVVVGDVNASLASARAAKAAGIRLAHVEAGLRSKNKKMQEEKNRIEIDRISDLLFVPSSDEVKNLKREKVKGAIHVVGNIMIDTLKIFERKIKNGRGKFYFATLHRAETVDNKKVFSGVLDALEVIALDAPIYLPLHPRTEKMAKKFSLMPRMRKIFKLLPPLSYEKTLFYEKNAALVLTDSGGIQEETSVLGTPCLTLRNETERPITVEKGTNTIAGVTKKSILAAYKQKSQKRKKASIPLWDGKTSSRILKILYAYLKS